MMCLHHVKYEQCDGTLTTSSWLKFVMPLMILSALPALHAACVKITCEYAIATRMICTSFVKALKMLFTHLNGAMTSACMAMWLVERAAGTAMKPLTAHALATRAIALRGAMIVVCCKHEIASHTKRELN
jgi:hypothetical protein